MTQDFYGAFGKDKFRVVGNYSSVNPIDTIGVDREIYSPDKRIKQLKDENKAINKN